MTWLHFKCIQRLLFSYESCRSLSKFVSEVCEDSCIFHVCIFFSSTLTDSHFCRNAWESAFWIHIYSLEWIPESLSFTHTYLDFRLSRQLMILTLKSLQALTRSYLCYARERERERERNTFLFVKSILQVLFGDFKASCAWHAWIKGSLDEKSLPVIFVVKWPFFLVLMRETPLFRWWILSSLRLTFSWNNLHDRLTNEIAIHYLGLSLLILSCLEESSLRAFVSKEQLQWFIRCLLFPHELLHFTLSSTRMQFPSRLTN